MKSYFTKKEQIVILIVVGVIVSIVGFKFFSSKFTEDNKLKSDIIVNAANQKEENPLEDDKNSQENIKDNIENAEENEISVIEEDIIVHISGQVKNPGIVQLQSGKRLIDAVEILGGLTIEADGDRINLAKRLQDEEKIYIPKIGEEIEAAILEIPSSENAATDTNNLKTEDKQDFAGDEDASGKIDINTCTKEMLNTLPGIGEVLSGRIIEYRETNLFKTIEDILNVSGIGAKKFEGIKELIIVK